MRARQLQRVVQHCTEPPSVADCSPPPASRRSISHAAAGAVSETASGAVSVPAVPVAAGYRWFATNVYSRAPGDVISSLRAVYGHDGAIDVLRYRPPAESEAEEDSEAESEWLYSDGSDAGAAPVPGADTADANTRASGNSARQPFGSPVASRVALADDVTHASPELPLTPLTGRLDRRAALLPLHRRLLASPPSGSPNAQAAASGAETHRRKAGRQCGLRTA